MADVGKQLRSLRRSRGLSQRELAKRAGVTNGTISNIEQNRVSPSVGSLKKVLDGFPVTLGQFFTMDTDEQPQRIVYRAARQPNLGNAPVDLFLLGSDRPDRKLCMLREVLAPGADTGRDLLSHDGEESGVVTQGTLELTVGDQTWVLGPGDGYYFESHHPHRFRNPGRTDLHIVSANTPPTF